MNLSVIFIPGACKSAVKCNRNPAKPTIILIPKTTTQNFRNEGLYGKMNSVAKHPITIALVKTGSHSDVLKNPFCAWSRTESRKFPHQPSPAKNTTHCDHSNSVSRIIPFISKSKPTPVNARGATNGAAYTRFFNVRYEKK